MLDIKVHIENDKVVIAGLQNIAKEMPNAIKRGLQRSAAGIWAGAFQWLNGPGAKKSNIGAGGYPVPVRTGHLKGSLAWLNPGESKSGDLGTFTAGDSEVVIFDSASYAPAVFLGRGSSAKFGKRDALHDALESFNRGSKIQQFISEEIQKEINKQGMKG